MVKQRFTAGDLNSSICTFFNSLQKQTNKKTTLSNGCETFKGVKQWEIFNATYFYLYSSLWFILSIDICPCEGCDKCGY